MRFNFSRNTKFFLLSSFLYGFSYSVWELFFNLYILSIGLNKDALGLIRSANPLAALVLGLPLGLLSDRIGRRMSMLIGLSVCFIGMFFQVQLLNPILIFIFGFIQGAGLMLYYIAQPPFIMSNSNPDNQAMAFSLHFGLLTISSTIGNLIAGQIPHRLQIWLDIAQGTAASYQWVITAGIVLAASSLIPILLISKHQDQPDESASRVPLKEMTKKIVARKIVRQMTLVNLLMGFGAAILIPYLNVFLIEKFNLAENLLGILFAASSLLVFVSSLISPWLVKLTHSRIIPTVITQAVSVVFLLTLGFSPNLWFVAISMLIRSVLMQMSLPMLENFSMLVSPPEEQGAIASLRGIGWQSGQAIGIFLSGLVQSQFGFTPIFIATSLCYLFAIGMTWLYFRPHEKSATHAG